MAAAEDPLPVVWEVTNRRRDLEAGAIRFELDEGENESLFLYFASKRERRGRMRIDRFFFELGETKGFAYDESLKSATISLPFPFAGRATFERGVKGRTSWTGSLSVLLPGTPRISLVGPRFRARLYRLTKGGIAKPGI